jgi:predicted XRE-type DNA-binding protein
MQKQKQKYYLIVEAKGLEHIIKECLTQNQVAEWLNVKQSAVNQAIKNNDIIKGRYKIEVIEADAD